MAQPSVEEHPCTTKDIYRAAFCGAVLLIVAVAFVTHDEGEKTWIRLLIALVGLAICCASFMLPERTVSQQDTAPAPATLREL